MPGIELVDTSIIKLRPCRFARESADRFGIVRRAGLSRVVVRGAGIAACERFRKGCAIAEARRHVAQRFQVAEAAVDLNLLLRSLQKADLIESVDGQRLRETCPPSLYSAYRYYLRFHLTPTVLRIAYGKLPLSVGKQLAHWMQRLDLAGALWPRAVQAEKHFDQCPSHSRPVFERGQFAKRYFGHLIQNIVDFQCIEAMTPAETDRWFGSHFEFEGLEHLDRAKSEGTPVILAGFHFAATKLLTLLLMHRGYDTTQVWLPDGAFDMSVVTRWHSEMKKIRPEFGDFKNIPDLTLPSYRRLVESLRNREVLVWFGDVFPRRQDLNAEAAKVFGIGAFRPDLAESRLEATLCGQPVYLSCWIGAFARMTGAAVVPAALIRDGNRMRMIVKPALRLPAEAKARDVEALNRALFDELDALLRVYPDQWFGWHNLYAIQRNERVSGDDAGSGSSEHAYQTERR